MFPSASSAGGPPPPTRDDQPVDLPAVPPSIIAGQGKQAMQQQQSGSLQKQSLDMATQKLLEYKNVVESLLTVFKAVDPESVALFMPAIEFGQALESRLQAVQQRAQAPQPSMAGMTGGASPTPQAPGGMAQVQSGGSVAGM